MGLIKNRIVIKVGTSTLTNENGSCDYQLIDRLARTASGIKNSGYEVILVTSGAIAVGKYKMRINGKITDLRLKQAAAAVGQCELMHIYDKFFAEYNEMVAQILLTADDIDNEEKKINLINTFDTLLNMGIIPIVNENDSVSYTEIETEKKLFSDNDMLSALVSILCRASKLFLLSDIEGLYSADPRKVPDAKLIDFVNDIDAIYSFADHSSSNRGTGGMITKLDAARLATSAGIDTWILYGRRPQTVEYVLDGNSSGTMFKRKE
ncbi:MAG: glutamate 5-kinase [Clostridiales bacterium]|nr:glutamate 5-kinase [Clostridiales bacterium]